VEVCVFFLGCVLNEFEKLLPLPLGMNRVLFKKIMVQFAPKRIKISKHMETQFFIKRLLGDQPKNNGFEFFVFKHCST